MALSRAGLALRRYALQRVPDRAFRRYGAARAGRWLAYATVVIDEMGEVSAVESAHHDQRHAARQRRLWCRPGPGQAGARRRVIASTQRPEAEAVTGQTKVSVPAKATLMVLSARRVFNGEPARETSSTERVTPCLRCPPVHRHET